MPNNSHHLPLNAPFCTTHPPVTSRAVPYQPHLPLNTDGSNRTAENLLEAHISTTTPTAVSPRNTTLSPLVALPSLSNQSQLDSHSTVATSTFCPGDWCLLLDNPLFDHLQDWEHPVSLFDEGIDSGTSTMQNNGLYVDITHSQLAQSHLHLPQIDWGSNQESPLLHDNQATIPVSIITYPQSTREIMKYLS